MLNIKMNSQENRLKPKITVIGVGGAGGNAVNNMISSHLEGCEFLVCNTDAQALEGSIAEQKLQLGAGVTRGLGAGANPDIGAAAAEESIQEIMNHLEGSNMVFVTAGMGGGTGTGAAPTIAKAARESGILTVGVVTKPFHFEGTHRMKLAEAGIEAMQQYVDTLIIIPNQNLFRIANEKTTFSDAFCMADEVLQSGVRGVTDLMVMPGLINLDFADIRSVMAEMGKAMMGTGEAEGDKRAVEAAEAAISNPLLDDVSMQGARGVLINITGGPDMTLFEVDEAANRIRDEVDPNANIIFGSTFDENMSGKMRVSVVATGIEATEMQQPRPAPLQNLIRTENTTTQTQQTRATTSEANLHSNYTAATANTQSAPAASTGGYSSNTGSDLGGASRETVDTPIPASIIPTSAQPAMPAMASTTEAPMAGGAGETATQSEMHMGHAETTTSAPATAAATATKTAEAEIDVTATHTKPMSANLTSKRPTTPAMQPRAQRHGNSFIPPKPMDAATAEMAGDDIAMTAKTEEAPKAEVTKPTPAARPAAPQKAPSFFERLTGGRRNDIPAAPAKAEAPAKALTVEAGGKTDEDDELDIPAFLRRQAN